VKPVPEIDPELHGLLDEIVRDPRSALRLTPRRALRHWFDTDERVGKPIDATTAERHLLAVHREALAKLLLDAAWIAYWKAPVLSYLPAERHDGDEEARWNRAAARRVELGDPGVLLTVIEPGLTPARAHTLACAALATVPSDDARYAVATLLPRSEQGESLRALRSLQARLKPGELAQRVRNTLGKRLCAAGTLEEACDEYAQAVDLGEGYMRTASLLSTLNLGCFLGDVQHVQRMLDRAGRELAEDAVAMGPLLATWVSSRPPLEVQRARSTLAQARTTKAEVLQVLLRQIYS